MNIKNDITTYICDDCHKIFNGKDVLLIKNDKNITISDSYYLLTIVDKDNIIYTTPASKLKDDDSFLACPHCKRMSFFGFTDAEVEEN